MRTRATIPLICKARDVQRTFRFTLGFVVCIRYRCCTCLIVITRVDRYFTRGWLDRWCATSTNATTNVRSDSITVAVLFPIKRRRRVHSAVRAMCERIAIILPRVLTRRFVRRSYFEGRGWKAMVTLTTTTSTTGPEIFLHVRCIDTHQPHQSQVHRIFWTHITHLFDARYRTRVVQKLYSVFWITIHTGEIAALYLAVRIRHLTILPIHQINNNICGNLGPQKRRKLAIDAHVVRRLIW